MQRLALLALLCLFAALPAAPQSSTTAKPAAKKKPAKKSKKKLRAARVRHYPPPRVSAQTRTASLQKVALQLDARPDPPIDRPGALVPFFERLYRLSNGESPTVHPVHIVHFGDSHTASDDWTGVLRDLFQNRFGNGGAGFSLAGTPFKGYRRYDVRGGESRAWDPPAAAPARAMVSSAWAAIAFPLNAPASTSIWMPTAPRSRWIICNSPMAAASS